MAEPSVRARPFRFLGSTSAISRTQRNLGLTGGMQKYLHDLNASLAAKWGNILSVLVESRIRSLVHFTNSWISRLHVELNLPRAVISESGELININLRKEKYSNLSNAPDFFTIFFVAEIHVAG